MKKHSIFSAILISRNLRGWEYMSPKRILFDEWSGPIYLKRWQPTLIMEHADRFFLLEDGEWLKEGR